MDSQCYQYNIFLKKHTDVMVQKNWHLSMAIEK